MIELDMVLIPRQTGMIVMTMIMKRIWEDCFHYNFEEHGRMEDDFIEHVRHCGTSTGALRQTYNEHGYRYHYGTINVEDAVALMALAEGMGHWIESIGYHIIPYYESDTPEMRKVRHETEDKIKKLERETSGFVWHARNQLSQTLARMRREAIEGK